ncbi:MAG: transposase [Deltaproteobacteria bacterium]|nr:transposase [Deltaproteobacteria bacterium]MDL1986195.1 transposase [Deltaproteobacteria bacterium]
MSSLNHFPGRCRECAKLSRSMIHGKCSFCQDLEFQENVLCHLNRCIQNPALFECYAFQPALKLVGSSDQEIPSSPNYIKDNSPQNGFQKLLDSDKIKYQRALALQRLGRDPDSVFVDFKYHFAWNVIYRKPVFARPPANIFDFVCGTFSKCSEIVGGFVDLLWLAPDHLHLYVESDGSNSVETIAQEMKRVSAAAILAEFGDLKASLDAQKELWDKAYFVETIG